MKTYDLIAFGTGSAMNIVAPFLEQNPNARVAVIDKDVPGGICLTRGCIPTKLLTHPADIVQHIEEAAHLGIDATIRKIDFAKVMGRMHAHVDPEIERIRRGLSSAPNIDYYRKPARFVAPYTLEIEGERITSRRILLCVGSKPLVPPIEGLDEVGYHTSDTVLSVRRLPKRLLIIGGGYIAAEFGHFFSAMGSKVTVVGRNERFLPDEEPEVSAVITKILSRRMKILTGLEVRKASRSPAGKTVTAVRRAGGKPVRITADEILVAAGRASNADLLRPQAGGLETDDQGWIRVDGRLETPQKGV